MSARPFLRGAESPAISVQTWCQPERRATTANRDTNTGDPNGETFTPQFVYHGFQYIQVTGLPAGYTPTTDTVLGLHTYADVPTGGSVTTSDSLINTIHSMAQYSIMSNMQSIFTDCPHREKLGWLADMIQSMGAIHSDYDVSSYLRGVERNMASSQQTTA